MGIAKAAIGNTTEAELNFKKALECNPGVADGYYFYGKFLIEKNRVEEARLIIKKGLLISSGYANLLTLKNTIDNLEASNLLSRLHSLEKLKKAANDKPTADIYIDLSLAYYNNNEFQKCIEAATKALSLNPSYDIAYNNICAAYNMLKQWDKAIEAGEKGLRINPNNQLLKNNLAESKKNRSIK
jgi:tetratricopeptide (TPR) repeat protein